MPIGIIAIWASGLVLWISCLRTARHFMKLAAICTDKSEGLSPDLVESRRRDMSAFHRAASWANLAGFATIFATLVAAMMYGGIIDKR
jgi:hypothetical protein